MAALNIFLAVAGLYFAARSAKATSAAAVVVEPDVLPEGQAETRGIKNKNPGNVTVLGGGQKWRGQIGTDTAHGHTYAVFDTSQNGLRAAALLLRNYQRLHGLATVRELISRYAPASANPTNAYVDFVSASLRVSADQPLILSDDVQLLELLKAVVHFENGFQPFGYVTLMTAIKSI